MKRDRRIPAIAAVGLVMALVAGCGGGEADTTTVVETSATVATRSVTTVGAVVVELTTSGEGRELESPLLAVRFPDGTQAVVVASAEILEDVGLGSDVLSGEITIETWGNDLPEKPADVLSYLLFRDDSPDTVILEESSDGKWAAISVGG